MDDRLRTVFRLAKLPTSRAADADVLLRDIEQRIRCPLPVVFRNFLAIQGAANLLARFSNCDQPIPVARLGIASGSDYDPMRDRVLPFMIESQGVCTWAVALDDPEDPRVLVEVDSMPNPKWQMTCESFADWLACQVDDHSGQRRFAAQVNALTESDMRTLEARFQKGRQTYAWPGAVNYRYSNARMKLLLWNIPGKACDWWVTPEPKVSDEAVLGELKHFKGLSEALYPIGTSA